MTLAAYVNHFAVDTSGTSRVLSGFGHQPKLWLPFLSLHTTLAGWSAADFEIGMGVTAGAAAEMAHCLRMNDAATGGVTRRGSEADSCLIGSVRNSNGEDGAYNTTSLDSDGVTLGISNAFGTALTAPYLSLGGSEITGADVLQIAVPNGTGDQTYTFTGLTAAPSLLLVQGTGKTSLGYGGTGAVFFGAADADGQWAMMSKGSENNPTESWRIFRDDRCYAADSGGGGGQKIRASFVSFDFDDTNGTVTLNWDAAPDHPQVITLIALSGTFSHKVGVFEKATGSPWTNTISLGATPRALFVASAAMTAMGTPDTAVAHHRGGIGIYDGTRARAISWQDESGVATSNIAGYTEDNGRILAISNNATASSNDELTPSFSGTDVIFTSAIEEAVAYEVGYVLFGDAAGGGPGASSIAVTTSVPSVTISTGASISASNIATITSLTLPTISTGLTVPATSISTVTIISTPTLGTGVGITAATVSTTSSLDTPDISIGATVTADTIAASLVMNTPSVETGGDVAIGAMRIFTRTTLDAPTISAGAGLTATTIATSTTLDAVTVSAGGMIAPATINTTVTVPAPTVAASSSVSAATISTVTTLDVPAVSTLTGVSPATILTITTLPAPSLLTGVALAPATIATTVLLPAPDVDTGGAGNRRGCQIGEVTDRRGCAVPSSLNRRACAATVLPAETEVQVETIGTGV